MITMDDIEAFSEGDEVITNYYGSEQDAFEEMNDALIVVDAFAALYAEEQDDFFRFAYSNWADYIGTFGVEWSEVFEAWRAGE